MSINYKDTVLLPKTDFPMKAGLARREPEILARWEKMNLYQRLREDAKGRRKFILHDGPPYANGHLHIGHALNKILKDVINRFQQMGGRDANYVPGWDCHGLPIEWKIEEQYRDRGADKDAVPVVEFRRECREFAAKWIDVQRDEFKRLGIAADWDNPYTTMSFDAEARIVRELGKFILNGGLYRGAKPVLWSVVEKTALAEAEVEYHDHTSNTVYVRFPVVKPSIPEAAGAAIVIWTTTPWTIPGNRAIAFSAGDDYVRVRIVGVEEGSSASVNDEIIVADALLKSTLAAAGISAHEITGHMTGAALAGTVCHHPLRDRGYDDFEVPLLAGDFVEMESGTGFVHVAPGHGADDWELAIKHGIAVPETVDGGGLFMDHVPLFAGQHVFKADKSVIAALTAEGRLLAAGTLVHSYPHSWRSKAPLIFRNTPQWFISMDVGNLRDKALRAIAETRFFPPAGRKRLHGMVAARPDWCVSRQRAWGVPITAFVHKESGELLRDKSVLDRISEAIEADGADIWFTADPARFLEPEYDAEDFEQVTDILDVWFDSGSTHAFVLETRDDLAWPASLYLEGSDQHRGWFHSSLLESCGTRGRAPYDAVLTHGFVMGADGQKMAKSRNNTVSPQNVVDEHGADILRLWVVGSDYSEDLRIGPDIIKHHVDIYRRLRNTFRFLLGNLNGFESSEALAFNDMPELERYILHRLWELNGHVHQAADNFEFHPLFTELHNFCAVDLSAFYFDIRKDSLYCDRADAPTRRAVRTVLNTLFDTLVAWLAPIICFTAEEAWLTRNPGENESVHLRQFPDIPAGWRNDLLAEKWDKVRRLRRVVTGALEIERAEKRIGSGLQAHPKVYASETYVSAFAGLDLAEIAITSGAELIAGEVPDGAFTLAEVAGVGVIPEPAQGDKCVRCFKVLPDTGKAGYEGICNRCAEAVAHVTAAAE